MVNDGIQVLNISNVNAMGKTVLNDGKLLELIQKYPFIYNPRVRAYDDKDYTTWAWKNINAEFNRSYANDPNAAFSTSDLIDRWNVLKPLIQCLSKAYDLEAIPHFLRTSVVKISTELDDQSCITMAKPNNNSQNLFLQNMSAIAELPMEDKLALEREILDIILSTELDSKHAAKLDEEARREIKHDTEEFLNDIGFKQVLLTSVSRREKIYYNNYTNQPSIKCYTKPKRTFGWVPLGDTDKFIKPCRVRIKRLNMEDYLPLSKIREMNKNKNKDRKPINSKRESPGIFGI